MKVKLLLTCLVFLTSCTDSAGLKTYWLDLVTSSGIGLKKIDCSMVGKGSGRTRAGYCAFSATQEQIDTIVRHLKLREVEYSQTGYISKGCAALKLFSSASNGTIRTFREGEKLPALPGNTDSSFLALYWNASQEEGCVDLHYPYG